MSSLFFSFCVNFVSVKSCVSQSLLNLKLLCMILMQDLILCHCLISFVAVQSVISFLWDIALMVEDLLF